jgi:hypothetical protein
MAEISLSGKSFPEISPPSEKYLQQKIPQWKISPVENPPTQGKIL